MIKKRKRKKKIRKTLMDTTEFIKFLVRDYFSQDFALKFERVVFSSNVKPFFSYKSLLLRYITLSGTGGTNLKQIIPRCTFAHPLLFNSRESGLPCKRPINC